MKVTVHDILVNCPKHGKVPYTATSDPKGDVVMYCPRCEEEARQQHLHPSITISNSRHITIRYRGMQSRRLRIADNDRWSVFKYGRRHR